MLIFGLRVVIVNPTFKIYYYKYMLIFYLKVIIVNLHLKYK